MINTCHFERVSCIDARMSPRRASLSTPPVFWHFHHRCHHRLRCFYHPGASFASFSFLRIYDMPCVRVLKHSKISIIIGRMRDELPTDPKRRRFYLVTYGESFVHVLELGAYLFPEASKYPATSCKIALWFPAESYANQLLQPLKYSACANLFSSSG